ncbi:uncharacterized protein LOC101846493 [Aplysia californica]|uniref:Uncharacterized protein LOC101846493 n=1 Tax=Aplysia californica TaxID=6500 RepID=A0ABM0ZWL5_APLCA|nr:uncharacterized protein LOC101846493 [Aplysia californica]
MIAGHTRTSLLRTLNSSGRFSPNEWLLPETKQLFQLQVERQRDMAKRIEKKEEVRTKRSKKLLKANQMSSKQWLSRHGLLTQRLTILDALGSTFVPHRPKYISILDKHVMSKVFDEVLPIAHVSKSQQVRLVNPNGVNLKDYETKLQAALDKYRQRLNTIVWNALSEDAKEQFDSSTPVDFEENTEKLYRLLEEADWPVREQDVSLLAREIARAQKFLGQSQALRKAAAGEGDDDDDEEDEEDDDERDDKSDQGKEEDNEPPVSSARSNSPRSNKSEASPTRSEAGSKDDEGVGQVIRSVDKSCEGRVKESSQVIRRKVKVKLDTLRRQKVIARRDQDGLYYPAVVQQCSDPRHASVIYDDGTHAHVLTRNVIPTGGAVARPPLTSGDCVLMRVVNLDSDTECYVPAIVQHGPHRQEAHSKFFSVLMYNGQKASTLRSYLVKISKERFELASMYIADQHNENRKDVEDLVYVSSPRFPKKGKTSSRKSADTRCDLSFTCDLPFTCDLYINRDLLTRTRSRSRSPSSEDSRPSSRESRHSVKEQKQTRSRSNSPSDGYESKGDSQDESGKSWRRESHRERQTDKLTTVKEEEKAQRRAGDTSPTLSEVESEGKRSEKSPQGSSAPGSRSSTPRNDSGDRNKESVRSQTSRSSELERLKQELLHQQARQERQKKKLKKKAKRLQRREKELTLKEEQDAADALVTPSADEGSTPRLIQLRKTLAQLRPGEEVLARWSDDGWYYRGMVRQSHDDCSYSLEDSTGFVERIWREDIISENDNADAVYELDHKVVALHPDYSFSYAPAAVTGVTDSEVEVRFYDARSARLPWSEAYHVTGEKYQQDVTYIAKRESELVGAAVVARDDETGAYYPGCVRRKEEDSCDYLISWSDGSVSVQSAVHIFSAFTRRRPLTVGDRVLAMADPVHVQFLPGHIAGSVDGKLVVQFCDGEMREGVDLTLCYWLGQQYYDMALQYYKAREPRHR